MLVVQLSTTMTLVTRGSPCVHWIDALINSDDSRPVGTARIAMIHVADAMDRGIPIEDVLDEDETLKPLLDVFFEDSTLRDEYSSGMGFGVIYFESVELMLPWRSKCAVRGIVITETAAS